jgi:hypothetical protein
VGGAATATNTSNPLTLEDMDNIELASYIYHHQRRAAEAREEADRASQVLLRRMEALGSRAVDHPGLTVVLEPQSPDYDQGRLQALYELAIPPAEVSAAYVAEDYKVIPAHWNGTKLRALATKWGGGVAALIEASKIPKPPRLKIVPKP